MYWLTIDEIKDKGLLRVRSCCFGCALIQRSVLERVTSRVDPALRRFDDYFFFMDCEAKSIPVYADTSLYAEHYPSLGGGSGWLTL